MASSRLGPRVTVAVLLPESGWPTVYVVGYRYCERSTNHKLRVDEAMGRYSMDNSSCTPKLSAVKASDLIRRFYLNSRVYMSASKTQHH